MAKNTFHRRRARAALCIPGPERRSRDLAQALPIVCVGLAVFMAVAGIVVDVGNGYLQRRATQNAADAAALAGAQAIPTGMGVDVAEQYVAKNDQPGDQVMVTFNGADTITVTVTRQVPTYLLSVLGVGSLTASSTAQARVEQVAQLAGHFSPYAVTRQAYADGTGTRLFQETSPGAYGTIDLPTSDNTSGGSCTGATNKGTPGNIKDELSDQLASGQLVLGGCLSVKPGASQPAATVVNDLPNTNDDMAQDLESIGTDEYLIRRQPWDDSSGLPPRLMYVPIVDSLPSGNSTTTITGFAWFYMTSATNSGSGLQINGKFVTIQQPTDVDTTSYVPGAAGQVLTVELTR